ncbi:hypothetical protein ACHAQJ_005003 [Trichoderma viride]
MERLQDIFRLLSAAGGAPSMDGKATFVCYEEKNQLCMRTWTGPELSDKVWVAAGVRSGTSAPIVNLDYKRVFVVDENNLLKCFVEPLRDRVEADDEDADEDEEGNDDALWEEDKELTSLNIRVHAQSQLAASYDRNTIFIFYQDPNGSLSVIKYSGKGWKLFNLPAANVLNGTPLATCNTSNAVYLFYISIDRTVRYMENSRGEWKDQFFSKAKIYGDAPKLTIAEDRPVFSRPRPLVFCFDNNILSTIKWRGNSPETMGVLEGREFQPTSDQQYNKYYYWSAYPYYLVNKRNNRDRTHAKRLQGFPMLNHLANQSAPMAIKSTSTTVGIEPTNAQAIIPPLRLGPNDYNGGGIPLGTSFSPRVYSFFQPVIQPVNNIFGRMFRGRGNVDGTEESAPESSRPTDTEAAYTSFETEGTETDAPHTIEIEINGVEAEEIDAEDTKLDKITTGDVITGEVKTDTVKTDTVKTDAVKTDAVKTDETEMYGIEMDEAEKDEMETDEAEMDEMETDETETETETETDETETETDEADSGETDLEETDSKEADVEEAEEEEINSEETQSHKAIAGEAGPLETDSEETERETESDETDSADTETDASEMEEAETEEAQTKDVQTDETEPKQPETDKIEALEDKKSRPDENITASREPQVPLVETPAVETPIMDTPILEVPIVEAPIVETPVKETPIMETLIRKTPIEEIPIMDTPIVETPIIEIPIVETPIIETPILETSVMERLVMETPIRETPVGETPIRGTPVVEIPAVDVFDFEESDPEESDPEESDFTEAPALDKGKRIATSVSTESGITPREIHADMNRFIKDAGLSRFYPEDDPYLVTVANNASRLKKDKKTLLKSDKDIQSTAKLNLYQPVLYCDDSSSMKVGTRVDGQEKMVRRVARLSTRLVPKGFGTSLQFINQRRDLGDKLDHRQVKEIMKTMKPSGNTKIGTNLERKILKPLIYDVINSGRPLRRPLLISCITDGYPSGENAETFTETILKCIQFLKEKGYPSATLRVQVSQIGNDHKADRFLELLKRGIRIDLDLNEVLYCTAERLDEQFEQLRDNDEELEGYLLKTLMMPINGEHAMSELNI